MFTDQELQAITGMCVTEKLFLEHCESRGVPSSSQQALVSVVRAKAFEELHRREKAAAIPADQVKPERRKK